MALGALGTTSAVASLDLEHMHARARPSATVTTLSTVDPARLVQSTGNLYWTANTQTSPDRGSSRLYRMSKTGTPGSERLIYTQNHNGSRNFFDLAYAKVLGTYFAYFVVNNELRHTSFIQRVPLAGGAARTVVASPRWIGVRDLVTDGQYLIWADEGGLRRSSMSGGAVTTMSSAPDLSSVHLGARVYFSSGKQIRSVAKTGGAEKLELTASHYVTSLFARSAPFRSSLYWAESDGSVRGRNFLGLPLTYQNGQEGQTAYSVSAAGQVVVWADCTIGPLPCRVRARNGSTTVSVSAGAFPDDVLADTNAMYWSDRFGVRKYTDR